MTRLRQAWVRVLLLLALATPGPAAAAAGAPTPPLAPGQREQIERIVHDYIMQNPQVMMDSLRALDARQQQAAEKDAQKALGANLAALERDPASPVGGNPNGDVTVVEFFDYHCGYCKKVLPVVRELLQTDGAVRMVFKEFPILGPESVTASRMALAAWKVAPEKYVALHQALMEMRGDLSEARVLDIASKVGIDPEKLKAASTSPDIRAAIEKNTVLAQSLQIGGTPAFIVGGKMIPGAVDLETLRGLVKDARAG